MVMRNKRVVLVVYFCANRSGHSIKNTMNLMKNIAIYIESRYWIPKCAG